MLAPTSHKKIITKNKIKIRTLWAREEKCEGTYNCIFIELIGVKWTFTHFDHEMLNEIAR